MNNKYKIGFFILLGILIGAVLTLAIIIGDNTKVEQTNSTIESTKDKNNIKNNKKNFKEKSKNEDIKIQNEKPISNEDYNTKNTITNNNNIIEKNNNQAKNSNNNDNNIQSSNNENSTKKINNNTNQTETSTDSEVLGYLEEKKNEVSSKIKDGMYKEKAKNIFIEVVDFLFYNGTIKGHTFNELTNKGKLEAIKIAVKIEDKIEEYQPGLIDSLGGKYKNIKPKIIDLYTSKVNEYCNNNPNLCCNIRNDYNKMRNTFKNAFGNIKTKISNFYQDNVKNSN